MWNKIKRWFCRAMCTRVQKLDNEEELLRALVKYAQGEVSLDVLAKVSEVITSVAMREKGKLDPIRKEALEKALEQWAVGGRTPREFRSMFRGGR